MRCLRPIAVLVALGACGDEPEVEPRRDRLRLTTHAGLAPMVAGLEGTFSWQLGDLVFTHWSDHLADPVVDGARVTFTRRADSPYDASRLATELRAPGLVRASASADGRTVTVELASAEHAHGVERHALLEVGPFRQASFEAATDTTPARLVLERRAPGQGFREIEITAVASEEEEWRRLLAGEADMIPQIAPAYVGYLDDFPTLRLVRFQATTKVGVLFRTEAEAVRSAEVRRAITLALRRRALARYAVGDEDAAVDAPEDPAEARRILAAERERRGQDMVLRMLVIEEASDLLRTALAVEQQLASFGVDITWEPVTVAEGMRKVAEERGTFDGVVIPGGTFEASSWPLVTSKNGVTNYENPELDAAVERRDAAAVRAILERDAPLTPLYAASQYLVADTTLCGIAPVKTVDYSWLADVRYCEAGE